MTGAWIPVVVTCNETTLTREKVRLILNQSYRRFVDTSSYWRRLGNRVVLFERIGVFACQVDTATLKHLRLLQFQGKIISVEMTRPTLSNPTVVKEIGSSINSSPNFMEESTLNSRLWMENLHWNAAMLGVADFWQQGFTGKGVNVALIDGGVSFYDLAGGVSFQAFPYDRDTTMSGHGTMCASIIKSPKNSKYPGIAPDCNLYSVKVLTTESITTPDKLLAALQWCVDNEIHVVCCSVGMQTQQCIEAFRRMGVFLKQAGITCLLGAGNESSDTVIEPVSCGEYWAVGAVTKSGRPWQSNSLSNASSNLAKGIRLLAPGVNVPVVDRSNTWQFDLSSGSFAAAHAAGMIALIKQRLGPLDAGELDSAIMSMTQRVLNVPLQQQGFGLIQAKPN